ncbi:hypothetical protein ACT691_15145 [Vibrio metschnikovii]
MSKPLVEHWASSPLRFAVSQGWYGIEMTNLCFLRAAYNQKAVSVFVLGALAHNQENPLLSIDYANG